MVDLSRGDPFGGPLLSDPNLLAPEVAAAASRLSDYEILRHLASSGGVSSYLARRRGEFGFVKKTLLKVADDPYQEGLESAVRLTDEARLAMRLHHPNLVQTLDLGRDDDRFFLVREWVEGLGLRALMHRTWEAGEPLPVAVSLRVAIGVSRALNYLHELSVDGWAPSGIVHQGIRPSNILVSLAGEVRLASLWAARPMGAAPRRDSISEERGAYDAPELSRGEPPTPRSDIYSVGVVLLECLTGRNTLNGATDSDHHRKRDDARLRSMLNSPQLDDALRSVLRPTLADDPRERPPTARALRDMLRDVLRDSYRTDGDELSRGLVARFSD